MKRQLPFELSKERSFFESLNDWVGDVLYDELPEKGFDLRDEQVFMSFQIEKALQEKKVLFAEAGVGTGKTIAYLLPSLAYARYTGKPALISCADETLIEQLVKEDGDIAKMSEALGLSIDVRLAKSRDQYVCLKRLEDAVDFGYGAYADEVEEQLPLFVYGSDSLQSIYPYGERSSYPDLTDEEWETINYNPIQQCASCDVRNRCGQTLHRNAYREASDFIICSHDFYMEHVWTKESRIRQEQLPLLPDVSTIIFDEGHLLEHAAQRALTYEVQNETLIGLIERVMVDDVRTETLETLEELIEVHALFFDELSDAVTPSEDDRMSIEKTSHLKEIALASVKIADRALEQFVFESEMYVIPSYELKMVEEYLEQYVYSMTLFATDEEAVDWVEDREGEWTLVIMPRLVTDILREKLFRQSLPIVFSSATLSVEQSFDYMKQSLGIDEALSFSVDSPFDYDEVMTIEGYVTEEDDKVRRVIDVLEKGEQTLFLFRTKASLRAMKRSLPEAWRDRIAFEGDRELSALIRDFSEGNVQAVASYNLWEGLDLPEHRLTQVVIVDLPLPSNDPLFAAKRRHAQSPFEEVDLPFMQLRLRQGMGRLIRTERDAGVVTLLVTAEQKDAWQSYIDPLFPVRIDWNE